MTTKQRIVIKFGGAAMKDSSAASALYACIAEYLSQNGRQAVLTHGGGPEIDATLRTMGIEPKKVNGLRVTDADTMRVVEMVLSGQVGKRLVTQASQAGIAAVSLSGIDGGLFLARRLAGDKVDLGLVGEVLQVRTALLECLLRESFLPIVCSVAADEDGTHLNVNADDASAALAGALGAERLILLTDVPGIMQNYPHPESVIPRISYAEATGILQSGDLSAGMLPKLKACLKALDAGVSSVLISDGRQNAIQDFLAGNPGSSSTVVYRHV